MSEERVGRAEDFARLAAQLRGKGVSTKQEINRQTVEAVPPEPDPEPESDEAEEFVSRLLSPKAGHAELVRRLHSSEETEEP